MAAFDLSARVARALREVIYDYAFTPHDGAVIVEAPSGDSYLADPVMGTCTCPDALTRCTEPGEVCKHVIAARHLALEEGRDLDAERRARRMAEWKAQMAAEREEIAKRTAWVTDELLDRVMG